MEKTENISLPSSSVTESFREYGSNTKAFSFSGLCTPARVVSIIDGDTCKIVIHWKEMFFKLTVRLDGIDTCEKTSKNPNHQRLALQAKTRLFELVTQEHHEKDLTAPSFSKQIERYLDNHVCMVCVVCKGFDKFGRVLVDMYPFLSDLQTEPKNMIENQEENHFAKILLTEKLAYEYFGGTKKNEEEITESLSPL